MSAVFVVQAALFQDGGLTILGPNIFAMDLIGTFDGYCLYQTIRFSLGRDRWLATAIALQLLS